MKGRLEHSFQIEKNIKEILILKTQLNRLLLIGYESLFSVFISILGI